ncbi:hypothetical protein ACH5RR_009539 [Cinchona calisaya]|uniref:Uncharacterized protein n=1 Tax=Cinchona calisaya TaxID=153742 RepID=A0ABD3AER4_9GENT
MDHVRSKFTSSKTIMIVGLSGSGKTLKNGFFNPNTQPSTEPNKDIPGSAHLSTILDEFFPQADGIVFLLDSVGVSQKSHAALDDKFCATTIEEESGADVIALGIPGEPLYFRGVVTRSVHSNFQLAIASSSL